MTSVTAVPPGSNRGPFESSIMVCSKAVYNGRDGRVDPKNRVPASRLHSRMVVRL